MADLEPRPPHELVRALVFSDIFKLCPPIKTLSFLKLIVWARSKHHTPRTGVTDAVCWPRPPLDRRGRAVGQGCVRLGSRVLVGGGRLLLTNTLVIIQ